MAAIIILDYFRLYLSENGSFRLYLSENDCYYFRFYICVHLKMAAITSDYIHLKMAAIISEYINLKMAAIISDYSIFVK